MHTEKGAAEHCCRTAPGVNNRSLASDLRVQRYELFTRRRDRLPSCACGHGSHDLAAAVHDPVVEPHKEVRSGDLGLGAENGLALSGVGRCIPGEDLLVGQPLPGLRELLEDSFYGRLERGPGGAAVSTVTDVLATARLGGGDTLCGALHFVEGDGRIVLHNLKNLRLIIWVIRKYATSRAMASSAKPPTFSLSDSHQESFFSTSTVCVTMRSR